MKRNSLPKLTMSEFKNSIDRKTTAAAIPYVFPEFKSAFATTKRPPRRASVNTSSQPREITSARASMFALPQTSCTYYLQVIFLSNYGNESIIGCSEIDVLDSDYKVLIVDSIGFDDQQHKTGNDDDPLSLLKAKHKNDSIPPYLSTLVNSSMIKDADTQEWSAPWTGNPIHFNIKVRSDKLPASIRIWNSRETDHRSVKNVKIYAGGSFIASGIIPEGFGGIISLEQSKAIQKDVFSVPFPRPETKSFSDKYGEVPNKATKVLKFHLFESFDKSEYIGLDSVEIVSTDFEIVTLNDIKSITYENINFLTAPHRLINNKSSNSSGYRNIEQMWYGCMNHQGTPQITITFKKAISILLIRIDNIPTQINGDNFGASKISILFDNEIVAASPLRKRTEKHHKPTEFWFTDVPDLKQKARDLFQ